MAGGDNSLLRDDQRAAVVSSESRECAANMLVGFRIRLGDYALEQFAKRFAGHGAVFLRRFREVSPRPWAERVREHGSSSSSMAHLFPGVYASFSLALPLTNAPRFPENREIIRSTMNTYRSRLLFLALVIILLSPAVHAAPVTWFLNGVTFSDGSRAVGSFVYDTVTGLYTSIDITTTPGTARSASALVTEQSLHRAEPDRTSSGGDHLDHAQSHHWSLRHTAVGVSGNTREWRREPSRWIRAPTKGCA